MPSVSNKEFLNAIFNTDAPWCHVTDFTYDPNDIPKEQHLIAWRGDYAGRYKFKPQSNQYFTISLFYADDKQVARRRKSLYRSTPVIVLDDVKEKLSMEEVQKLPSPSWVLETSPGSEQWGYILNEPCEDRHRVENLLDGLVSNGLAPDGRDPGMKGVTRYVRLPDGYNTKQSKMINGQPFKCDMTIWEPFRTVTLEQLAAPFHVDLDAVRREARVDGAAAVNDHPLLDLHDIIHIKEVRSDGRFDITCPWVDEHTGGNDSGSAIFTNSDGTIGFKCHHGACQERTGRHLLSLIERHVPGFGERLTHWQAVRAFNEIKSECNTSVSTELDQTPIILPPSDTERVVEAQGYQVLIGMLRSEPPFSDQARQLASQILKSIDSLPAIEKLHLHDQVREIMRWSKPEFKQILDELRQGWYLESKSDISFFDDTVYIAEQNKFFDRRKRIFFTAEAYQNMYAHLDADARKEALQGGRVTKVDKIDYAPLKPAVFEEKGIIYGNSWYNDTDPQGVQGDVSRWLEHFNVLGWGKEADHIIKWMAHTIRHPDKKINHMLILGSGEGCGKDWLLYPLVRAMGENHLTISGEDLLDGFSDYVLSTKHLHINEAELGDRKEAVAVSNKLKPLAAAPPDHLRVNIKGVTPIKVRNLLSCTMTTNSQTPVRLNGTSRRIFAAWSNLDVRDENDEMLPEWLDYWEDRWTWMRDVGADACIWYLKHIVDLSNFNPAAAPPMTQFLRDIAESSKSPLQQTVEIFLREKIGIMECDFLSSEDINKQIRDSQTMAAGFIYVDMRYVTPQRIDQILKGINRMKLIRSQQGHIWIVRNQSNYAHMTSDQQYDEYSRQIQVSKSASILTSVGN